MLSVVVACACASAQTRAAVVTDEEHCKTQERHAYANVRVRRTHADMGWGRAWQGGSTPLHMASEHGLKTTVQLLIDKGADVNATDKVRTSELLWR
jgi:hypothetical protein